MNESAIRNSHPEIYLELEGSRRSRRSRRAATLQHAMVPNAGVAIVLCWLLVIFENAREIDAQAGSEDEEPHRRHLIKLGLGLQVVDYVLIAFGVAIFICCLYMIVKGSLWSILAKAAQGDNDHPLQKCVSKEWLALVKHELTEKKKEANKGDAEEALYHIDFSRHIQTNPLAAEATAFDAGDVQALPDSMEIRVDGASGGSTTQNEGARGDSFTVNPLSSTENPLSVLDIIKS